MNGMDRRRILRASGVVFACALGLAPTQSASAEPTGEPVRIDLRFEADDLARLSERREEDAAAAKPVATRKSYVPARLSARGQSVDAEIRLDGEYPDSAEQQKWPLRIKLGGDDHLLGLRRMSVQAPAIRAFQLEPLVLRHLRREGVMAPSYRFVRMVVNGDDAGLMALEERFSRELLESQRRREGVVVRLEEKKGNGRASDALELFDGLFTADVDAFRDGRVAKLPILTRQLETARGLLRAFLQGELPARDVFDLELMARYLAVAEIWRATPLLHWRGRALYFNPVTQLLEPAGHAADLRARPAEPGLVTRSEAWSLVLLEDADLRARFVEELRRIAAEVAEGGARGWLAEEEARHLPILRAEYPDRAPFDPAAIEKRAASLATLTEAGWASAGPPAAGSDSPYPRPVRAHHKVDERGEYLEIVNQQRRPLQLTALHLTAADSELQMPVEVTAPAPLPLTLAPLDSRGTPSRVRLYVATPPKAPAGYRLGGSVVLGPADDTASFEALPSSRALEANPLPRATLAEARESHPFLTWDADEQMMRSEPGVHRIAGSLVLPAGVGLDLPPGTTLRFGTDAMLMSTGPLIFRGTATRPVVLEGSTAGVDAPSWQGIVVLESERPHSLENVRIRNTTGIEQGSWELGAGVTVRDSEIAMTSVDLVGNRSEDALNLIRTRFRMFDVSIRDTPSDALDADFSDGEVRGGSYRDIGGDGIDVSGAEVVVDDVELQEVRDKAVSVGERSQLLARNLRVSDVGTGLASKDGSVATIEDSVLSDIRHTALMAYIKKAEYGPAELVARNVRMDGVQRPAVAQLGSSVSIDGVAQAEQEVDVETIYESGYMRK